jgi:secreted PhoX family phosphatase
VRVQAIEQGATPIPKAEGTWRGLDGGIWLVSSYGEGPHPKENEPPSLRAHGGQVWRYDPRSEQIELAVLLRPEELWDGPDNLTATPYGFAIACTDGHDGQWLVGIGTDGTTFPFARNAQSGHELTGVTISPDGQTLFVNAQGGPATTYAIWGPWTSGASGRRG